MHAYLKKTVLLFLMASLSHHIFAQAPLNKALINLTTAFRDLSSALQSGGLHSSKKKVSLEDIISKEIPNIQSIMSDDEENYTKAVMEGWDIPRKIILLGSEVINQNAERLVGPILDYIAVLNPDTEEKNKEIKSELAIAILASNALRTTSSIATIIKNQKIKNAIFNAAENITRLYFEKFIDTSESQKNGDTRAIHTFSKAIESLSKSKKTVLRIASFTENSEKLSNDDVKSLFQAIDTSIEMLSVFFDEAKARDILKEHEDNTKISIEKEMSSLMKNIINSTATAYSKKQLTASIPKDTIEKIILLAQEFSKDKDLQNAINLLQKYTPFPQKGATYRKLSNYPSETAITAMAGDLTDLKILVRSLPQKNLSEALKMIYGTAAQFTALCNELNAEYREAKTEQQKLDKEKRWLEAGELISDYAKAATDVVNKASGNNITDLFILKEKIKPFITGGYQIRKVFNTSLSENMNKAIEGLSNGIEKKIKEITEQNALGTKTQIIIGLIKEALKIDTFEKILPIIITASSMNLLSEKNVEAAIKHKLKNIYDELNAKKLDERAFVTKPNLLKEVKSKNKNKDITELINKIEKILPQRATIIDSTQTNVKDNSTSNSNINPPTTQAQLSDNESKLLDLIGDELISTEEVANFIENSKKILNITNLKISQEIAQKMVDKVKHEVRESTHPILNSTNWEIIKAEALNIVGLLDIIFADPIFKTLNKRNKLLWQDLRGIVTALNPVVKKELFNEAKFKQLVKKIANHPLIKDTAKNQQVDTQPAPQKVVANDEIFTWIRDINIDSREALRSFVTNFQKYNESINNNTALSQALDKKIKSEMILSYRALNNSNNEIYKKVNYSSDLIELTNSYFKTKIYSDASQDVQSAWNNINSNAKELKKELEKSAPSDELIEGLLKTINENSWVYNDTVKKPNASGTQIDNLPVQPIDTKTTSATPATITPDNVLALKVDSAENIKTFKEKYESAKEAILRNEGAVKKLAFKVKGTMFPIVSEMTQAWKKNEDLDPKDAKSLEYLSSILHDISNEVDKKTANDIHITTNRLSSAISNKNNHKIPIELNIIVDYQDFYKNIAENRDIAALQKAATIKADIEKSLNRLIDYGKNATAEAAKYKTSDKTRLGEIKDNLGN